MTKILVTGFKGKHNSSSVLAQAVADRLASAPGVAADVLLLTNSFAGLRRDIELRLSKNTGFVMQNKESPVAAPVYTAVLMLGVDTALSDGVRVEGCAALDGEPLYTAADTQLAARLIAAQDVACAVSEKPTAYLCNAAYYHALRHTGGRALFIHIPPQRHMAVDKSDRLVCALADITRYAICKGGNTRGREI